MNNNKVQAIVEKVKELVQRGNVSRIVVRKGERVLLIDDFLARGEAACGAARLIEEAGAQVAAIGIVIEKAFQPGRALLDGKGYRVISLARVSKMGEGNIEFTQADA